MNTNNTTAAKSAALSALILLAKENGHTIREAFDLVLGDGAFMKLAGEVWEALQPQAPAPVVKAAKVSIVKIRETIQALDWARDHHTGGTTEENKKTRLPELLAPYIAKVEALVIPARFAHDLGQQARALRSAAAVIERWRERQTEPEAPGAYNFTTQQ